MKCDVKINQDSNTYVLELSFDELEYITGLVRLNLKGDYNDVPDNVNEYRMYETLRTLLKCVMEVD
ncbi:MAG: hypothetical protein WC877_02050 [Dehalococcoidales bacterium]|jgi:hypothetical protein